MINTITGILSSAVMMCTPLFLGAIGEVFSERAGVMVCAIEGIFLLGAWGGFVGAYASGSLLVGLILAVIMGVLMAALYGFVTICLKQQQIVMGTAVNILAAGLAAFFQRVFFGIPTVPLQVKPLIHIAIPLLSKLPIIGQVLFNQNIITYLAYILFPISFFVLYKTSVGLTIRSCGENPASVDTAGINVNRVRFLTVIIAGALGGLAGSFYTIGYLGMFTTGIIGGRGWIAFAICFLGNWNPKGALYGTLVFGITEAITIYLQSTQNIPSIPNEFIIALPYILTIALTVSKRSFAVPKQLGIPYNKEL